MVVTTTTDTRTALLATALHQALEPVVIQVMRLPLDQENAADRNVFKQLTQRDLPEGVVPAYLVAYHPSRDGTNLVGLTAQNVDNPAFKDLLAFALAIVAEFAPDLHDFLAEHHATLDENAAHQEL